LNWQGQENLEDWLSARVSDRTQALLRTEQLELAATLDQVLLRHSASTLKALISRYGIASPVPSRFALELVASLSLSSACGSLITSLRTFELASMQVPDELTRALSAAGCRG
jgi:hypothetical protein